MARWRRMWLANPKRPPLPDEIAYLRLWSIINFREAAQEFFRNPFVRCPAHGPYNSPNFDAHFPWNWKGPHRNRTA